jgi:hypothetical protein
MLALVLAALCSMNVSTAERDQLVQDAAQIDGVELRNDGVSDMFDDLAEQGYDLSCAE